MESDDVRFLCDAMHGGLTRWLRAAGHDAAWRYGIDDKDLIAWARAEGRVILTSDAPLMEDQAIRQADPKALFVPRGLQPTDALEFVLRALELPVKQPRCMPCGGSLVSVPKDSVASEAPPKTFAHVDAYFRCSRCGKLFWEGSHWRSIEERLSSVKKKLEGPGP